MAWLRPGGARDGGEAYQLRFLAGAITLATVVSALAVTAAAGAGQWHGVALTGGYLALILAQALAVRLGAPIRVVAFTIIATVGLLFAASALVPSENQAGQLYWFLLVPLAARAFAVPRHDTVAESQSWRTGFIAGGAALLAVVAIVAYLSTRSGISVNGSRPMSYGVGIDVALFLMSALGLLYVHDLSVRETTAELRRLQALLSMCAWCRKIKSDGEWVGLEQYMAQRKDISLTHGMCPTCYEGQLGGE
ncbi:hypothetical protein [Gemmatimonas phototrophica]|uniref:Uncharacterized protein n=1 Tax=Gemmatimonas phototrophica TaxID=1379270 RepID=A0A143BHM7_9BACT|nr:hypothetical protein [Gemmatimonas phototrophica]AMW03914.1 hypothetical protein GEMMAAP_01765 [Gemmatimonas phototrophica]